MRKAVAFGVMLLAILLIMVPASAKGNPHGDGDCQTTVTDSTTGETGTREELYNCKPIGNSGEEQGIYNVYDIPSDDLEYEEDHGTCDVLVKWSGDYGGDEYLDYGKVFNRIKCSDGYLEVWGDRWGADDGFGETPYVHSIKGDGTQLYGPE